MTTHIFSAVYFEEPDSTGPIENFRQTELHMVANPARGGLGYTYLFPQDPDYITPVSFDGALYGIYLEGDILDPGNTRFYVLERGKWFFDSGDGWYEGTENVLYVNLQDDNNGRLLVNLGSDDSRGHFYDEDHIFTDTIYWQDAPDGTTFAQGSVVPFDDRRMAHSRVEEDDYVLAHSRGDLLDGGIGADTLLGYLGNDTLLGGPGHDRIEGGAGDDSIVGGDGEDTLTGDDGNDTIDASQGATTTQGDGDHAAPGAGHDLVIGHAAAFAAGNGLSLVYADVSGVGGLSVALDDTGSGTVVSGRAGAKSDTISYVDYFGGSWDGDSIRGSDGDHFEVFSGMGGDDTIDGGAGWDAVDYGYEQGWGSAGLGVTGDMATGLFTDTDGDTDLLRGIEEVWGTDEADSLTATGVADRVALRGLAGADTLIGGEGNDVLRGGLGADWLHGGAGNDSIVGANGSDTILGGGGNDTLWAGNDPFTSDLTATFLLDGGDGDDVLHAHGLSGDRSATLMGGAGNDTLYGALGNVKLLPGAGDDIVYPGYGGSGTVTLSSGTDQVFLGNSDVDVRMTGADYGWGQIHANAKGHRSVTHTDDFVGDVSLRFDQDALSVNITASNGTLSAQIRDEKYNSRSPYEPLSITGWVTVEKYPRIAEAGSLSLGGTSRRDSYDIDLAGTGTLILETSHGRDTYSIERGNAKMKVVLSAYGIEATGGMQVDLTTGEIAHNGFGLYREEIAPGLVSEVMGAELWADSIRGSDDDDTVVLTGGDDTTYGRGGIDTLAAARHSIDNLVMDSAAGQATGTRAGVDFTATFAGFERLRGTDQSDTLRGGAGDDTLSGLSGSDVLEGGAGDDVLEDGYGADVVRAGDGNDLIHTTGGEDTLFGNAGDDTLAYDQTHIDGTDYRLDVDLGRGFARTWDLVADTELDAGRDVLGGIEHFRWIGDQTALHIWGSFDANQLEGAELADRIDGRGANDTLRGLAGADTLTGGGGDDLLEGGAGADSGEGGQGLDTLWGHDGADLLRGQSGDDQIYGGNGDDTVFGGNGADVIWAGDGRDRVEMGGGADLFHDTTDPTPGNDDTVFGQDGDDTLLGGNGFDLLVGGSGSDSIRGGQGFDTLLGGDQADSLDGNDGNDRVDGGRGADYAVLGRGADVWVDDVQTDHGDDRVFGGGGWDTLNAAGGDDTLTGGAGADSFVFAATIGDVIITDYAVGEDALELATALWDGALSQSVLDGIVAVDQGNLTLTFAPGGSVTLLGVEGAAGLLSDIVLV